MGVEKNVCFWYTHRIMNDSLFAILVQKATTLMNKSHDPIHDTAHARRVVNHVSALSDISKVTGDEKKALIIAAWWHDVARIITKKPSLVWMPMVDDLISGFMLLAFLIKHRIYDQSAFLAARMILGKSLGTGAFIKKILLSKRNQFLADLLKDADTLDTFAIERFELVLELVEESLRYEIGYKIVCRWFSFLNHINMKTEAARTYVLHLFHRLINWIKQPRIIAWHIEHFGKRWTKKSLRRIDKLGAKLTKRLQATAI
jgi:hypothetical protein